VFVILIYAPTLLCLPVLLVVGLVFVVIPGGFIVVLGGLYYQARWRACCLSSPQSPRCSANRRCRRRGGDKPLA
jgi:hypothetical protein